jgi:hypothetical protein
VSLVEHYIVELLWQCAYRTALCITIQRQF